MDVPVLPQTIAGNVGKEQDQNPVPHMWRFLSQKCRGPFWADHLHGEL